MYILLLNATNERIAELRSDTDFQIIINQTLALPSRLYSDEQKQEIIYCLGVALTRTASFYGGMVNRRNRIDGKLGPDLRFCDFIRKTLAANPPAPDFVPY